MRHLDIAPPSLRPLPFAVLAAALALSPACDDKKSSPATPPGADTFVFADTTGGGDSTTSPDADTVGPVGCTGDADCLGAIPGLGACQVAVCQLPAGTCVAQAAADGTGCDDQNPCTVADECQGAICLGQAKQCQDDNPCTDDACSPATGECAFTPNTAACDDANLCTEGDHCEAGVCAGTVNPLCQCTADADCDKFDDADLCNGYLVCKDAACVTAEDSTITCDPSLAGPCQSVSCDPTDGKCKAASLEDGAHCDDANDCTKSDACSGGVCKGKPISCDDKDPCTDDVCDPDGGCGHTQNTAACDDGDPCTLDDVCAAGACSGSVNPACVCAEDADCAEFEDGNLCNGTLKCEAGACEIAPATVVDCSAEAAAAPPCHKVTCDPTLGACQTKPSLDGTTCADQNPCTKDDHCVGGICKGLPVLCDDANPCTEDTCDLVDGCTFTPTSGGACDDGNACTSGDACAEGVCVGTTDPTCECETDADCGKLEDGDLCNGTLRCLDLQCIVDPSTVVACDTEGLDPCVLSQCVPATGKCAKTTLSDGTPCDDGNACTAPDFCSGAICKGKPVKCDDGDICTEDACEPDLGCVHEYGDAACDDGNGCTSDDHCVEGACVGSPVAGCVCAATGDCAPFEDGNVCNGTLICQGSKCVVDPGTVVECEPAADVQCSVNQCNPLTGACNEIPFADGKPCDDDDACTVIDECIEGLCIGDGEPDCDDGDPCTHDACESAFGCVHPFGDGEPCDDGNSCTEGDTCLLGTCMAGDVNACPGTCEPAWTLHCGSTDAWGTGLGGATDAIESYGCNTDTYPGPEYAYTFKAPYDGELTVTLSDEKTLTDVMVIASTGDGCDPAGCVGWDYASATVPMEAGSTYFVVVDGYLDATGSYVIDVACKPAHEQDCDDDLDEDGDDKTDCDDEDCAAEPICLEPECAPVWTLDCGESDSSANYAGGSTDVLGAYEGCENGDAYPGPEYTYLFVAPATASVTVSLANETAETDIIVLTDDAGHCYATQCVAYGLEGVTFDAIAGNVYYLVVDGYNGEEGTFDISLACVGAAASETACGDGVDDDGDGLVDCEDGECLGAEGLCQPACIPDEVSMAQLACPTSEDAWNNGGEGSNDLVTAYGCNAFDYAGAEYVYTFEALADGPVTITQTEDGSDLDILLLEDRGAGCNPASCVAWALDTFTFEAKAGTTYYVVVDGFQGAVGDYTLAMSCGE